MAHFAARSARALPIVVMAGCLPFHPLTQPRAIALARRNVCGSRSAADPACTVEGSQRIPGGYRVVIRRQPPAGQDIVAVVISHGGDRIEVAPVAGVAPRSGP